MSHFKPQKCRLFMELTSITGITSILYVLVAILTLIILYVLTILKQFELSFFEKKGLKSANIKIESQYSSGILDELQQIFIYKNIEHNVSKERAKNGSTIDVVLSNY